MMVLISLLVLLDDVLLDDVLLVEDAVAADNKS
jgi:hypothetical protein